MGSQRPTLLCITSGCTWPPSFVLPLTLQFLHLHYEGFPKEEDMNFVKGTFVGSLEATSTLKNLLMTYNATYMIPDEFLSMLNESDQLLGELCARKNIQYQAMGITHHVDIFDT